jgi:hypothetical protein
VDQRQRQYIENLEQHILILKEMLNRGDYSVEAISSEADARSWESAMSSYRSQLQIFETMLGVARERFGA